ERRPGTAPSALSARHAGCALRHVAALLPAPPRPRPEQNPGPGHPRPQTRPRRLRPDEKPDRLPAATPPGGLQRDIESPTAVLADRQLPHAKVLPCELLKEQAQALDPSSRTRPNGRHASAERLSDKEKSRCAGCFGDSSL